MNSYIHRIINIEEKLRNKSLFLFGPRQTGKSSIINHQINDDVKFYYQIVSKTPISVYVDASGPMISTDENGNIVEKLGWDITSKNSAVEFSSLTPQNAEDRITV